MTHQHFERAVREAKSVFGVVSAIGDHAINWVEGFLADGEETQLRLVISLHPTCRTSETVLQNLLWLVERHHPRVAVKSLPRSVLAGAFLEPALSLWNGWQLNRCYWTDGKSGIRTGKRVTCQSGHTGKRLILLPDQSQYIGDGALLKAITGGDEVPINRKGRAMFRAANKTAQQSASK